MHMKLLFATDMHGQPNHLQELARLARTWRPDLLLVGGDALPDADPTDPAGTQADFVLTEMRRYFEDIKENQPAINIGVIFGNHDWICTYDAMTFLEKDGLLQIIRSDKIVGLCGYSFLGYWCAPPCPYVAKDFERLDFPGQVHSFKGGLTWNRRLEHPVDIDPGPFLGQLRTIQEDLAQLPPAASPDWILVAHAPPLQTELDLLSGVGHVGSQSIRQFIQQRQPLLSLHGHIHESPRLSGRFWQYLGRTIAINPGQRDDGLAAVLIELTKEAVILTPLDIEGPSGRQAVTLHRPVSGEQP
jgi:uncharacterized protein